MNLWHRHCITLRFGTGLWRPEQPSKRFVRPPRLRCLKPICFLPDLVTQAFPMDPLNPISPQQPLSPLTRAIEPGEQADGNGISFSDLLKQSLRAAGEDDKRAEDAARDLMVGAGTDMHTAMLAVQKADINMMMMMAVRSKLIDAYREVMRMQL